MQSEYAETNLLAYREATTCSLPHFGNFRRHVSSAKQPCFCRAFLQKIPGHAGSLHHMNDVCFILLLQGVAGCCRVLLCVAECCRVLQCAALCCGVLQCVAVCCSVL